MKKTAALFMAASLTAFTLTGCSQDSQGLTHVTLNEVAHSIFYAPQYAAIELGYFKDEGLDLALVNGAGADKVMTALISGDADIGFMGSEASVYVYQEGSRDYAVNFAQLTQRAGNFLVGRAPEEHFSWQNLKGKKVLGGRAGGRPCHDGTFEPMAAQFISSKGIRLFTVPVPPFLSKPSAYHREVFLSYICPVPHSRRSTDPA